MTTAGNYNHADKDGQFRRQVSTFRSVIPCEKYPAEAGRYVLYFNYGCPWAQRANIMRSFKHLEDIIERVELDDFDPAAGKGWFCSGKFGPSSCPITGIKYLRELYLREDPEFSGRATVPTLYDKKTGTIVNNESAQIVRMLLNAFDELLPEEHREVSKAEDGLLPALHESQIDSMNEWVYDTVNNGVYKAGFATTQEAYEEHIYPIFDSLERLDKILAASTGPYLFGKHITLADIHLYPTIIRFDVGYASMFRLNIKMVRHDYPHLYKWLRTLYWDQTALTASAFHSTTKFDRYKMGYSRVTGSKIVPVGPLPNIHPL